MKIILLGLSGAGKGTVGKRIANRLAIPHISIGDRVRVLAQENSPLGERLRHTFAATSSWTPLADDLATDIADSAVRDLSGWILDGFPRNVAQAESAGWLHADLVIHLAVSQTTARQRVLGRRRDGDSEEKIQSRLAAELTRLPPLLEHLGSQFRLVEIDANPPEDTVIASVLKTLEAQ